MKQFSVLFLLFVMLASCKDKPIEKEGSMETVCNPMNLNYRFQPDPPSRREAADPSVLLFQGKYFLFVSKSGGYWHSEDLNTWTFVETNEIPTEEYAPTAIAIDDTVYFLASSNSKSTIYKSSDPLSGKWSIAKESLQVPVWDPAFFLDDDKRLYLYWGCSNVNPIYGVELDYGNNFSFIGSPKELIFQNPARFGWEVPGDYNSNVGVSPWIEGPWLNKYQGRYYLQYAGPGTEFKSYSDGVYTSESPLGPYAVSLHNPFAYKPGGYATGAGHGSTFSDAYGNYWHIGTVTISQKHVFERRLALFPTFFDESGVLHSTTKYGDYPMQIPRKKIQNADEVFPGWMLLSYRKDLSVSSSVDSLPPVNMCDENIRTYWASASGESNEWASIDLGEMVDVYSIQINFADHNTDAFGIEKRLYYQYTIEVSDDNVNWELIVDKSENLKDNPHDYVQLAEKVNCRYVKIKNKRVGSGHFALSGFRVFGKGMGEKPESVAALQVLRNPTDRRSVELAWTPSKNATGYVLSYGSSADKLYHSYMVYADTSLVINSLDAAQEYFFSIEAFNENGITYSAVLEKTE